MMPAGGRDDQQQGHRSGPGDRSARPGAGTTAVPRAADDAPHLGIAELPALALPSGSPAAAAPTRPGRRHRCRQRLRRADPVPPHRPPRVATCRPLAVLVRRDQRAHLRPGPGRPAGHPVSVPGRRPPRRRGGCPTTGQPCGSAGTATVSPTPAGAAGPVPPMQPAGLCSGSVRPTCWRSSRRWTASSLPDGASTPAHAGALLRPPPTILPGGSLGERPYRSRIA
jgi:hypothetical protein